MPWINPKTDWAANPKNPMSEDFNRIEGNIDFLKQEIEAKKGVIVDALVSVGVSVNLANTYAEIATSIINSNQGQKILTPKTTNVAIPKGFHNGTGYVVGSANLIPGNIKSGVSIFGVVGSLVDGTNMKKWASGTTTIKKSGIGTMVTVSGLSFTPSAIIVKNTTQGTSNNYDYILMYLSGISSSAYLIVAAASNYPNVNKSVTSNGGYVSYGGFSLEMSRENDTVRWWAFE